ncbi:hypothetical protein MTP99_003054 [Tenebrio molitor]|jgi:ankyrin repeat protein|nr:hypothetical protein MTP99_003054 [Tenebrio molitor]
MAGRECITPVVVVAKLLMEKGVDVNVINSKGSTPLVKLLLLNPLHHIAVIAEFVPALLCFGADPECVHEECSAFEITVNRGHPPLMQEILF